MERQYWKYREGIFLGASLMVAGLLLQLMLGSIKWEFLSSPVNFIVLFLFLIILLLSHHLRRRFHIIFWLGSIPSAATALGWTAVFTVIMGLVKQNPSDDLSLDFPGFDRMVSNWSFTLLYCWLAVSLGLTILRVCIPLKMKRLPFLFNHLGLFIALVCGVLGSADVQKLKMVTEIGKLECRAADENGRMQKSPLAVELLSFNIEEYPPELVLVDGETRRVLPEGKPEHLILDSLTTIGGLDEWTVCILKFFDNAIPVTGSDTMAYVSSNLPGSCTAVLASASKPGGETVTGWISCGNYLYPRHSLKLGGNKYVVMPEREPQRFISTVKVSTPSGKTVQNSILVNKPLKIDGWKIYQVNYDRKKGRWSDISVLELVSDPWRPAVYAGIVMMILGAVCMFIQFGRKR